MTAAWHLARGRWAEKRAARFLTRQGLKVVARNFRCKTGELDLVLREADVLVVAEVRFRSRQDFGSPLDTINARKRARLVRATQAFLLANPEYRHLPIRFDVVGITGNELKWVRAAFDAGPAG